MNSRWYNPALGRFTQPDTIVPISQDTQAWDRFAYVNNNPVKYTDPTGHCYVLFGVDTLVCVGVVAVVALVALSANPQLTADAMEATADLTADTLDWASERAEKLLTIFAIWQTQQNPNH